MSSDAAGAGPDDTMTPGSPEALALRRRILRFERTLSSRMATTTRDLPFGTARLCPDLPLMFAASGVEVTHPAAVSEVLRTVGSAFADVGLAHRRITTAVAEVAWSLAPALADRGWQTERLVTMVHDGRTTPPVSPLGFDVVGIERWAPAARRFVAGFEWGGDPAVQADRGRWDQRLSQRVGARFVLDRDGVAGCHVYRHGHIAQIEEVSVLAEGRGQGLGQGLMAAAMAQCAGASVVFLVADAEDWPQRWYRRLGFTPIAAGWDWIRRPPDTRTTADVEHGG
ncbi:MAG TPA: GNAT family N-acetyltransferase [Euzebya sp.]|nr:GNAT family N-acetyltransferase [Euzebya sp.]